MFKHAIIENWADRAGEIEAILNPVTRVDRILAYQGQRININDYQSLILTGSPLFVTEPDSDKLISWEMGLVEQALKQDVPILGVCFGHQLIAKVLGANVTHSNAPEVGWYKVKIIPGKTIPFLNHLEQTFEVFQYHFQEVYPDSELSHEVVAHSPRCYVQAFQYGNAFGIQFHPEISPEKSREIFSEKSTRESLLKKGVNIDAIAIEPKTQKDQAPRDDIFKRFVKFAESV